jgi:hypothetical protein
MIRFHAALLRMLPSRFRSLYGVEMRETIAARHTEVADKGRVRQLAFWAKETVDLFKTLAREWRRSTAASGNSLPCLCAAGPSR